jgi:hypothetical protein
MSEKPISRTRLAAKYSKVTSSRTCIKNYDPFEPTQWHLQDDKIQEKLLE